jgi:hypothetical protein
MRFSSTIVMHLWDSHLQDFTALEPFQIVQDARLPREQIASEPLIFGDLNIASF